MSELRMKRHKIKTEWAKNEKNVLLGEGFEKFNSLTPESK